MAVSTLALVNTSQDRTASGICAASTAMIVEKARDADAVQGALKSRCGQIVLWMMKVV